MSRHRLQIWTQEDREKAVRGVRAAPKGYVLELRAPTRSLMQNARLWAMLDEISTNIEWYGQKLSAEHWKEIFSAAVTAQKFVPGIEGGVVALGVKTSQMTIQEMGDLMEYMTAWAAERGVVFNFPEDRSAGTKTKAGVSA